MIHKYLPTYRTVEQTGRSFFRVEMLMQDSVLSEGEGSSLRAAKRMAAHKVLHQLKKESEAGQISQKKGPQDALDFSHDEHWSNSSGQ